MRCELPEKIECVLPRRPLQTVLAFDSDQEGIASASSAAPRVDQGVEAAERPSVVSHLEPGDPDADLEMMSDGQLTRLAEELRERPDAVVRRLKAIVLLRHRGLLAGPRWARLAAADPSPAKSRVGGWPGRSAASARRRLLVLLGRVKPGGAPAHAEALAEFLAQDLIDSGSIGRFRTIAGGIREGLLDPRTVRAAYRAAKKPGVRKPGSLLWSYVAGRSPEFGRWLEARSRAKRDAVAGQGGLPRGDRI
jgi:hypothetical protein